MDLSKDDPYVEVNLLEQALALALQVPRFPPRKRTGRERERYDHAVEALSEFLSEERVRIRKLIAQFLGLGTFERAHLETAMTPENWGSSRAHLRFREDLVEQLLTMRRQALDTLRVLPTPDEQGRWVRAAPYVLRPEGPTWAELHELDHRILPLLVERRLGAKQLAAKLGIRPDAVRDRTAQLKRQGVLDGPRGGGYFIRHVPIGAPADLFASG